MKEKILKVSFQLFTDGVADAFDLFLWFQQTSFSFLHLHCFQPPVSDEDFELYAV